MYSPLSHRSTLLNAVVEVAASSLIAFQSAASATPIPERQRRANVPR